MTVLRPGRRPTDILRNVAQVDYAVAGSTGLAIIKRDSGQYDPPYTVYKATFEPVTLDGGVTSFGNDPSLTPRSISADGDVHISGETEGMFGSNDTPVARGLWATLGTTASLGQGPWVDVAPASGFVSGGAGSTNSPSKKRIRAIIAFSSQLGLPPQDKQPCDPLRRRRITPARICCPAAARGRRICDPC